MSGVESGEHLGDFYRRYIAACNDHAFDRLGEFISSDVLVNDEVRGLTPYVSGLHGVVAAFPDYRWNLQHLATDDPWIFAHFTDTGTHRGTFLGVPATGRPVRTQEFAVYRMQDGLIAQVWVAADNLRVLDQIQ